MRQAWPGFLVAALVVLLDRVSKVYIESHVSRLDSFAVIPNVFHIVYTRNRGAAFGFLADSEGPWRAVFLISVSSIMIVLLGLVLWRPERAGFPRTLLVRLSLGLLVGGAAGNLYDRVVFGSVTDFLQVFLGSYEFPSFNVADSAITIGVGLLAARTLFGHKPETKTV